MGRAAAITGFVAVVIASAAAAVFHPAAGTVVVLALALLAFFFSSALNATLAFIIVLVLRPSDLFPALAPFQLAKITGLIAIFLWVVSRLIRGDLRLSKAPHGRWMLYLCVAVLFSSIASTDPASSLQSFTDVFLKVIIMFVLMIHVVDTKPRAFRLHLTLAACTTGLALYAIHQKWAGQALIEGNRAAFVGLLADPNDLALVLLMYVPFFVELVLESRGIRKLLWAIPFLILAYGIFTTVSRGGALGLVAAIAMCFYDRGRLSVRLVAAPTAAAIVFALILVAGVNERASGAINHGGLDHSSQTRLDAWRAGARMLMLNPALGVGFDQFAKNYDGYVRNPVRWGKITAHNTVVQAAGETGLAGLIPFMALLVLTFRTAYRLRKAEVPDDKPRERAVRRALLPAMTGFCVSAFFLSQAWGWFLFIMFAQSAAMHEIWRAHIEPLGRSDLAQDAQVRDKLELGPC